MSRDIKLLHPSIQAILPEWQKRCKEAGHDTIITSTARTYREQLAIYSQGRETLDFVNMLRKEAGLEPILEKENKVVSWTMASKHITNLKDSDQKNDSAKAFDFALKKSDGTIHWDIKTDVDQDQAPDYEECGKIGESMGLIWGGRWKSPDYAHLELP